MVVRDTSIMTYEEILSEGLLGRMEQLVFKTIHDHPFLSDQEYAEMLKIKINQMTGRRNSLVKNGCVIDAGIKEMIHADGTVRHVHVWSVPNTIKFSDDRIKQVKCPYCNGSGYMGVC